MADRVLVLLSGGVDSAVTLWMLKHENREHELYSLAINYHRRSLGEERCAARLAARAGVKKHIVIETPFIREIEDLPDHPHLNSVNSGRQELPPVFIPMKNLLFYSLAAHIAFSVGANRVVVGHNLDDSKLFPDVGASLIMRFNQLVAESLPEYRLVFEAPLLTRTKREVYRMALELGVPLEETWSCWRAGEIHCGMCEGCLTRRRMFSELGVEDKTLYESLNSS